MAGADRTEGSTDPDGTGESATVVAESGSIVEPIDEPAEAPEPSELPTVEPESSPGPERAEESEPSEEEAGESQPSGQTDPGEEAELSEQPETPEVPQTSEPPEPPESPEVTGSAAPTPGMLDFFDCGRVYWCVTLAVPIDHDDPNTGTINLSVGALPAGDPSCRIGYLLGAPKRGRAPRPVGRDAPECSGGRT